MPQIINIESRKFFNQIENGSDFTLNTGNFTTYLQGNAGGKYKAQHEVSIKWWAVASSADKFTFVPTINRIIRTSGDFLSDGFVVGDTIEVKSNVNDGLTATITYVDSKEMALDTAVLADVDSACIIAGTTSLDQCEFKYGLIDNDESMNFISKVDGSIQRFTATGLSGTAKTLTAMGASTWQNGSVDVSTTSAYTGYVTVTDNESTPTTRSLSWTAQGFVVEHEFILNPVYLDGQLNDINTVVHPELWESINCLRYVFSLNATANLQDPNVKHEASDNEVMGNTGWLNENFNGLPSDYSLTSVAYKDKSTLVSIDGLQVSSSTQVTAVIAGSNFSAGDAFVITHHFLPLEAQYKGAEALGDNYEQNFLYEGFRGTMDAVSASGALIENVVVTVDSSTQITAVFDINFSASQQAKISTEGSYLLSLLIGDENLPPNNSNEVMLKIDSDTYSKGQYGDDVAGLITFSDFEIFQHFEDKDVALDGSTNIEAYIEDKVLTEFTFNMDWSGTTQPKINKVVCRLVVLDDSSEEVLFDLQSETYDMTTYPLVNIHPTSGSKGQVIDLDTTRGFKLVSGSDFNLATFNYSASAGTDLITYKAQWALAFNWQDYKVNPNATTEFFDPSEENDGLNYDASHYSLNILKRTVRVVYDFYVTDTAGTAGNETLYRYLSRGINVFDYATTSEDPDYWTVTKKLTNQAGTDTSLSILNTENTKIYFKFSNSDVADIGVIGTDIFAVIRMEQYQNGGLERIYEISSILSRYTLDNPLIPLTGQTYAKLTKPASNEVEVEAEIDKDKIDSGKQYSVSCRIFTSPLADVKQFEDGVTFQFEDGDNYEFEN